MHLIFHFYNFIETDICQYIVHNKQHCICIEGNVHYHTLGILTFNLAGKAAWLESFQYYFMCTKVGGLKSVHLDKH